MLEGNQLTMEKKNMKKSKKIKTPNKLKKLGFKKLYQDKDGFFMFEMTPSKLNQKNNEKTNS